MEREKGEDASPLVDARYRREAELARGGMAVVYRALDTATGNVVALKQLHADVARQAKLVRLFQQEFRTLARLRHQHIVEVFSYGLDQTPEGSIPYYTMELLDGQDLQHVAPLPFDVACRHVRDVASALALLHAQRLIHRDISPRNIRLTRNDRAKLIDFGALTHFGVPDHVVGTAPFIPPEALHGEALDQRADLYSLGALLYWLTTGRHAYPAHDVQELHGLWESAPPPPSHYNPDIPAELDNLVLGLLSLERVARPVSCADVIERITTVTSLPPAPDVHAAKSYLQSAVCVGREPQLEKLRRRIDRLLEGRGSATVVGGARGSGKTRLLSEAALEGELRGARVLHVQSPELDRPYALLERLLARAAREAGSVVAPLLRPELPVLAHVMPKLQSGHDPIELATLPEDPGERRQLIQDAIRRVLKKASRRTSLLLLVDDLELGDEPSIAALTAIARAPQLRLMLVAVIGESQREHASGLLESLSEASRPIDLHPLEMKEVQELLLHLFGDVPHSGRLALKLHEITGGYPASCIGVLDHLMSRGVIVHRDGVWVLPQEVHADDVPSDPSLLGSAGRLDALSSEAHALARVLSLYERPADRQLCEALLADAGTHDAHALIDELLQADVLGEEPEGYRFARPAARSVLRDSLSDVQRARGHARLAAALEPRTPEDDPRQLLELGWHRLLGGDEMRGAEQLARAADALYQSGVDLRRAASALEAAIEIYDRHDRSSYERAVLLCRAVQVGYHVDRRIAERHGERAMRMGLELSGLARAQRMRRYVGRKPALIAGVLSAEITRRKRERRGEATVPARTLIKEVIGLASVWASVVSMSIDRVHIRTVTTMLEPLTLFDEEHVGQVIYDWATTLAMRTLGDEVESERLCRRILAVLQNPELLPELDDRRRAALHTGVLYVLGTLAAYENNDKAMELAAQVRAIDAPLAPLYADQLCMCYHAMRGEARLISDYADRVERRAIEGGSTWQAELQLPAMLMMPACLSGDVLMLKRVTEEIGRLSQELPHLDIFVRSGEASLTHLRGDPAGAARLHARLLEDIPFWSIAGWCSFHCDYVQALNDAEEYERAKAALAPVRAEIRPEDRRYSIYYTRPDMELAIAEAGLGNHARAVQLMDDVLAREAQGTNPRFMGSLHAYRARIALMMGDGEAFEEHYECMAQWFRSTENPSLARKAELLTQQARAKGIRAPAAQSRDLLGSEVSAAVQHELSRCTSDVSRHKAALQLLLTACGAEQGWLYMPGEDELQQVAGEPDAPPAEVLAHLQTLYDAARMNEGSDDLASTTANTDDAAADPQPVTTATTVPGDARYAWGLLRHRGAGSSIVGAVLVRGRDELRPLRPDLLLALGDQLLQQRTQTSMSP